MNSYLKTSILAVAVAATTLATLPAAQAGDWRRHHHRDRTGAIVAAGVLGLATGAIIAGASRSTYREPVYVERYPRDYYPPAPAYRYREPTVVYADRYYAPEPWSREWFRYCDARYRTFNPDTGTYVGYDGREHFCEAR